ncbi:MurT ligase domain-containing protein [Collinsella sp. AGMB00827]|uniref:Lipid II isoglutaminyl synthase (glutamine-hydrolyzing) subunit MurT n=1 Tax=Collinsella ureilytica TaxID=2869515 RepID=A0ABS7MHT7_9ACTN|nr:MurT ligase domain-containing protein [Collinsella urealyticum]MBY4796921.1 MurT ligase domain-containing protein [Collinsella urealyticum]
MRRPDTPDAGQLPRSLRFFLALLAAKLVSAVLRLMGRSASQFPGSVAERICPDFLSRIGKAQTTVCVTGTNGKTTTTNLLDDILIAAGKRPIMNRSGSNLLTGIGTSLLGDARLNGSMRSELASFELDELSCRLVLPPLAPEFLVVTNLYRDSFMRNANPDYIYGVIQDAIQPNMHLILNADDLITCRLGTDANRKTFFSIGQLPESLEEAEGIVCDLAACPECGGALEYEWCHLRHLGRASCSRCGFHNPAPDYLVTRVDRDVNEFVVAEICHADNQGKVPEYTYRIKTYSIANLYNLLAAITAARELGIPGAQLEKILASDQVAITSARYSEQTVAGTRLVNLASKGWNSTAVSTALRTIRSEPGSKAVVIFVAFFGLDENARTTEFPGWIYQVDFDHLLDDDIKQVIIHGCYAKDLLLRLELAGVDKAHVVIADDELDAANRVQLEGIDAVFCAFDIEAHAESERFRDRVAKRLTAGF